MSRLNPIQLEEIISSLKDEIGKTTRISEERYNDDKSPLGLTREDLIEGNYCLTNDKVTISTQIRDNEIHGDIYIVSNQVLSPFEKSSDILFRNVLGRSIAKKLGINYSRNKFNTFVDIDDSTYNLKEAILAVNDSNQILSSHIK